LLTKSLIIEFKTPYHVGWRRPEPIIDGLTVHRSLLALSSMIVPQGLEELVEKLRVSAILPAVRKQGQHEPLIPLPPIPSKMGAKKAGLEWATLRATSTLAGKTSLGGHVILEGVERGKAVFKLASSSTTFELCVENGVLKECDEDIEPLASSPLERFEAVFNRVDRVTGSADLFKVSGYRPRGDMMVVIQSASSDLLRRAEDLLRLLGVVGVGGLRSRGFGKFVVKGEAGLDTKRFGGDPCAGPNVMLGSYLLDDSLVDLSKSYVITRLLAGYSGPTQDTHILPYLSIAGAGSILYFKSPLKHLVRRVETASHSSLLVFNPVAIGCCT